MNRNKLSLTARLLKGNMKYDKKVKEQDKKVEKYLNTLNEVLKKKKIDEETYHYIMMISYKMLKGDK